jgi:cellulose synthase/poly-beta-1,6-N-acetylglucosamine synthase-like glycosyltransferase
MILTSIVIILLAAYGWLFFFYQKGWNKGEELNSSGESLAQTGLPVISIVIAARNEEAHIIHLLTALNNQTYPSEKFEVLVVNDHSTDKTAEVVSSFAKPILINAGESEKGKKKALTIAIQHASGELIVATDADCIPGPYWLACISEHYLKTKSAFLAAPVMYKTDGSLLSIFQTIDFITLQGITAAGVETGFHSMCNGANLAYTKTAFEAVNGFEGIDKVASGDDLLLMHKISEKFPHRVHYLKSKAATVVTTPPESWKEFYAQRIRWASKTNAYQDKKIYYALLLVYFVNLLFPMILVFAFWNAWYLLLALFYLMVKTLIEYSFIKPVAKFFNQEDLLRWFPLLQPLHIFYTVTVGLLSQFGSYEWKGRKTK